MIVISHRGAHAGADDEFLENTEPAIRAALEAYPAGVPRAIEVDLRPSFDGHPFLFHDDFLDRLTAAGGLSPGAGRVRFSSLAADAIERLALAKSARVLSLARLFEIVPADGRTTLHLEFKDPDPRWVGAWEKHWRGDSSRGRRVVLSSFHPDVAAEAARRGHAVHYLTRTPSAQTFSAARALGALGLDLALERAEPARDALEIAGIPLFLYVVDTPDRLARARALGAAGVFSDDPRGLFRLLAEK